MLKITPVNTKWCVASRFNCKKTSTQPKRFHFQYAPITQKNLLGAQSWTPRRNRHERGRGQSGDQPHLSQPGSRLSGLFGPTHGAQLDDLWQICLARSGPTDHESRRPLWRLYTPWPHLMVRWLTTSVPSKPWPVSWCKTKWSISPSAWRPKAWVSTPLCRLRTWSKKWSKTLPVPPRRPRQNCTYYGQSRKVTCRPGQRQYPHLPQYCARLRYLYESGNGRVVMASTLCKKRDMGAKGGSLSIAARPRAKIPRDLCWTPLKNTKPPKISTTRFRYSKPASSPQGMPVALCKKEIDGLQKQRGEIIHAANLLIGCQEQMGILQDSDIFTDPLVNDMLGAMSGTMTLTDQLGTSELLPGATPATANWAEFPPAWA